MPNTSLFPETPSPIQPDPDRPDPVVWIRRLFVVEKLSPHAQIIQQVKFRRGLNVIRAAERPEDEERTVGHSVGKTLLVRLIRYCLGEQAYCTKAVRESIANKLPEAYVVGEFFIRGEPWIVARPLGIHSASSSSKAAQTHDLTVLLSEGEDPRRASPFSSGANLCLARLRPLLPDARGKMASRATEASGPLAVSALTRISQARIAIAYGS